MLLSTFLLLLCGDVHAVGLTRPDDLLRAQIISARVVPLEAGRIPFDANFMSHSGGAAQISKSVNGRGESRANAQHATTCDQMGALPQRFGQC